jgi:hypothetical protein
MKNTRKKSNGMRRHMLMLPVLLVAVVALILGAAPSEGWAQPDPPECFFNIELNASDLDVGVRGFFDYAPWVDLLIIAPAPPGPLPPPTIADVMAVNNLADQGFAEWFFESGEPTLADVPFSTFLPRFPEGTYLFDSNPLGGGIGTEDCQADFTHVIPCAPEISAAGNRGLGVTISWDDVTEVVDPAATDAAIGANGDEVEVVCVSPGDLSQVLEIVGWEVIVETEVDGEVKIYEIDLPADATSVSVPPEFIALGEEFQFEVLAIEISGNQTITEEDFCVNERNGQVEECPDE